MARLSKQVRQQIVEDFARRHGGRFEPSTFLTEVQQLGDQHPAHTWFEWDDEEAAQQHRVEQARDFARGLRVSFRIEEVSMGRIAVRQQAVPLLLSPMGGRKTGGGYHVVDPDDPHHMAELSQEAASALRGWLGRYGAVLPYAGASAGVVEALILQLENGALAVSEAA